MFRFARRSRRFGDAYLKGLEGKAAAWVVKRSPGHRTITESVLQQYDDAVRARAT